MLCTIQFPAAWVTTIKLDEVFAQSGGPHSPQFSSVTFKFPSGCKIMIDAVVRILSVANQLMFSNKQVRLVFNEKPNGIMGYLDRMGFFDYLDEAVEVLPYRPKDSTAEVFRGKNIDLVEIAGIDRNNKDRNIVPRMADTLSRRIPDSSKNESFENAFYIVLGELIGNIYRHCEIDLNGFAALQTYKLSNRITIAVSDSGPGIIETLRPVLSSEYPKLTNLTDSQLMKEIFSKGLSRFGDDNGGTGLFSCGRVAKKYNASIEVRQNCSCFNIIAANGKLKTTKTIDNQPNVWGTHISFNFEVDME